MIKETPADETRTGGRSRLLSAGGDATRELASGFSVPDAGESGGDGDPRLGDVAVALAEFLEPFECFAGCLGGQVWYEGARLGIDKSLPCLDLDFLDRVGVEESPVLGL